MVYISYKFIVFIAKPLFGASAVRLYWKKVGVSDDNRKAATRF